MKKLIYIFLFSSFAGLALQSCEKAETNYVEGKLPDERLREFVEEVRTNLREAPNGWWLGVGTPTGLSFTYYVQFAEGNRVRMYSDFNEAAMVEAKESSYAIRNTGIPSLIFDSFNYIHLPADPDPQQNNGTAGTGLSGDFEFSIQRIAGDTIVMQGNLRNNEVRLIRATAAERAAVESRQWPAARTNVMDYFASRENNYINVSIGGQTQMVGIDLVDGRKIEFFGLDGTTILTVAGRAFISSDERIDFGFPDFKGVVFRSAHFDSQGQLMIRDAAGQEYRVQQASSSIVPLPPFFDHFGYGKQYNYFLFNGWMSAPDFRPTWDAIQEESISEANRVIRDMRFSILPSGQLLVRVYRHAAGTGTGGTVSFSRIYFNEVKHANGSVSYTYTASGTDGNSSSSSLRTNSDALLDFLSSNKFVWDWRSRAMIQGGLFVVDDAGNRTSISVTGTLASD